MKKLTIALLSGGISSERDVSIASGNQVYEALDRDKYEVLRYDPKTDLPQLIADAANIDAALIILHGPYGEDGTVQGLLDLLKIPYQGSGVLGSAIGMNKRVSKQLYQSAGLPVAPHLAFKSIDMVHTSDVVDKLGLPVVVKPVTSGSSIGLSVVKTKDSLRAALERAFAEDHEIIIEAYIKGIELTGGVVGNNELQALPLVEIIPGKEYEFFDYAAKYTPGASEEVCPARVDEAMTAKAQTYAKIAHRALCCKGYSRTDMIVADREIYVLETNTIPGMTPTSLLPQAAGVAGISFSQLLDKLIELSLEDS